MLGIHQQGHQMRGTAARAGSLWAHITHQENSGILETHGAGGGTRTDPSWL